MAVTNAKSFLSSNCAGVGGFLTPVTPALFWVAADQWLKFWCTAHFRIYQRQELVGKGWFALTRVLNRGVIGDQFSNIPQGSIEAYTRYAPSLVFLALSLMIAMRWRGSSRLERSAVFGVFFCGGSNLWDHWRSEYVVDTFQIYAGNGESIPFNLADVGILFGTLLLLRVFVGEWNQCNVNERRL